jgi:hypothetical protein
MIHMSADYQGQPTDGLEQREGRGRVSISRPVIRGRLESSAVSTPDCFRRSWLIEERAT